MMSGDVWDLLKGDLSDQWKDFSMGDLWGNWKGFVKGGLLVCLLGCV